MKPCANGKTSLWVAIALIGFFSLTTAFFLVGSGESPFSDDTGANSPPDEGLDSSAITDNIRRNKEDLNSDPIISENIERIEKAGYLSRDELLKILKDEGLDAAWAAILDQNNENYRRGLEKYLMRTLGELNRTEEALNFITRETGIGSRREQLTYSVVSRSNLPVSELLRIYDSAEDALSRKGMLQGIKFQIMGHGITTSELESIVKLPSLVKKEVVEGLSVQFSQKGDVSGTLEAIEKLIADEGNSKSMISGFVDGLPASRLKELVSKLSQDSKSEGKSVLRSRALMKLSQIEPEWLIGMAAKQELTVDSQAISNATSLLVRLDPNRAVKLLEEYAGNKGGLRSNMAAGISQASTSLGEFDVAWEWTKQIEEPELRKKVEGQIWGQEKKVIEAQMKSDPKGTIDSIVEGTSVHSEFWIKEAFSQWNFADSGKAKAWYEENRKTLTPPQNQHIARSYADQAIAQGDLDTAREWAKQVIDEKFQQVLREKIEATSNE